MKNIFEKRLNKGNPFIKGNDDKGAEKMEINDVEINETEDVNQENGENADGVSEKNDETKENLSDETEQTEENNVEESEDAKKLKADFESLNNQYIRLAADFDNYRKRQAQEREALLKYGAQECMKKVLEVVDNFDRAIAMVEKIDDIEKMKETFFILNKQLTDSLTKLGLEQIKCVGEKFDPNLHEAVMQTPTDEYEEDTVINEMQKGYKLGDKVLRPAMVAVAVKQ